MLDVLLICFCFNVLTSCRIKSIENLENLTKLDVLDLHGNKVGSFDDLFEFVLCVVAIFPSRVINFVLLKTL